GTELRARLWRLCVRVTDRMKAQGLQGSIATLKLKRADFRLLTRRSALAAPTQLAEPLFATLSSLLSRELGAGPYRLIGAGLAGLSPAAANRERDLFEAQTRTHEAAERAVDALRARFGDGVIGKGRGLIRDLSRR
ncbi:MAG: DNA polymerase IV, partial [Rubrimonas sp.]